MSRFFPTEIKARWDLSPRAFGLTLQRQDGQPIDFIAGQFFMVHLTVNGRKVNRSYSVANPTTEGDLELCIARVSDGLVSLALYDQSFDEPLTLSGPYGRFLVRMVPPETLNLILIGTGTGVAPFRAMLQEFEIRQKSGLNIQAIFGFRHEEDVLYQDEFQSFFGTDLDIALSGPKKGKGQRVTDILSKKDFKTGTRFMVCGNQEMVKDVLVILGEKGFSPRDIMTEAYHSPPDISPR